MGAFDDVGNRMDHDTMRERVRTLVEEMERQFLLDPDTKLPEPPMIGRG